MFVEIVGDVVFLFYFYFIFFFWGGGCGNLMLFDVLLFVEGLLICVAFRGG